MSHSNTSKETSVLVDASPVGLSAILTQKDPKTNADNTIAYASRALFPVEQLYSQTKREALAIVWGVEHFHLYLFGVTLQLNYRSQTITIDLQKILGPSPPLEKNAGF